MRRRLATTLLATALALALRGQPAAPPATAQATNPGGPRRERSMGNSSMKSAVTLASDMNVFRLSAGAMADRALQVWASPAFQAKWAKEVLPLFPEPGDRTQLHDFFSSAVVLLGRITNGFGVAGFYNPWQDGILLIATAPGKEHASLTDFCFIAGETWRGETVKTGEDVLALYILKEPLTITLARKYAATVDKFNRLYPVEAPFVLLPDEAKQGVGRTGEELALIKGRMLYRAKMFRTLFEKQNRAVVQVAKELRALLPAGNEPSLRAYLSSKQNAAMLDSIGRMPAMLRQNLSPNYFVRNNAAGGTIMALVNSEMPRWVFAVQILDQGNASKPTVSIEAMDLEASKKIVANLKEQK